jgi:succinate dehydrogenase/fumarate reductase flavoprotein subunit/uncharacterized protein with FMN-binding domain
MGQYKKQEQQVEKNSTTGDLSRRGFLAGAAVAGMGAAFFGGLSGCTPASGDDTNTGANAGPGATNYSLTPGVYTATAKGRNGEIPVSLLVGAEQLVEINIGTNTESAQFGAKALEKMSSRVVEQQYVDIDTFTGATMTYLAFSTCVKDCLTQAGNGSAFNVQPSSTATEVALTTDVVVVGSGIAGQAAALSAVQNGAKVIMLDRLSLTGGAATGSGGAILAANSPLQIEAGGATDPQLLVDHLYRYAEYQASEEMISHIVSHSAEIIQWYMDLGVEFELGSTAGALNDVFFSHRAWNPDHKGKSGSNLFDKAYPAFVAAGGVAMVDTPATELIQDSSGKVTGVKATHGNITYNIACDAVILAAGGYEFTQEKLDEWSPHIGMMMVDTLCHSGDYGDGISLGLTAGGYFVGHGYAQATGGYSPIPAIKVTEAGVRYSDEMHSEEAKSGNQGSQFKAFFDAGIKWAYTLFDSSTSDESAKKALDRALEDPDGSAGMGLVVTDKKKSYKGETIEAVATAAGVDPAGLSATVEKWNGYVVSGVDADFGTANPSLYGTYEDGPFYLVPYTMGINGTIGGLKIDFESQVLREDGSAIPGLYAAGETCNGEYMYRLYPSGGASLLFGSVTGKIAGANAAKLAKA